jgi:hypothetical protein
MQEEQFDKTLIRDYRYIIYIDIIDFNEVYCFLYYFEGRCFYSN